MATVVMMLSMISPLWLLGAVLVVAAHQIRRDEQRLYVGSDPTRAILRRLAGVEGRASHLAPRGTDSGRHGPTPPIQRR